VLQQVRTIVVLTAASANPDLTRMIMRTVMTTMMLMSTTLYVSMGHFMLVLFVPMLAVLLGHYESALHMTQHPFSTRFAATRKMLHSLAPSVSLS
jgi:hypothetical protein